MWSFANNQEGRSTEGSIAGAALCAVHTFQPTRARHAAPV